MSANFDNAKIVITVDSNNILTIFDTSPIPLHSISFVLIDLINIS